MDLRVGVEGAPSPAFRRTIELAGNEYNQMVSKCSNPHCSAPFLYLHSGKLFRFDTPSEHLAVEWDSPKRAKKAQFFWLCEACVKKFTLVRDAGVGPRMVALQQHARVAGASL